jgi:hypothetical protein
VNRRLFCSNLIAAPVALASVTPGHSQKLRPASSQTRKPHQLLFAAEALHDLHISLDRGDWSRLCANVLANDYYPAALSMNGTTLPEIRVRARGRNSRNARKPGLRVDLEAGGKKSAIPAVAGFVLGNLVSDATLLHDWLAMKVFRKAGISAPRRSFARVFVNNEYRGVYALGEEIGGSFLRRHFREKNGHLYEYHSTPRLPGASASSAPILKALNHRKADKPGRGASILSAIQAGALAARGGKKNAPLDLRHLATVLAVESFCDDRHGLLSERGPDGLYYYSARKPSEAFVIPWGRDEAFLAWQRPPLEYADRSPLARRVLEQEYARSVFQATLADLATLAGSNGWLEGKILNRYFSLRGAALEDPFRPGSGSGFDQAVQGLVEFARRRGDFLKSQL